MDSRRNKRDTPRTQKVPSHHIELGFVRKDVNLVSRQRALMSALEVAHQADLSLPAVGIQ